MFELKEAVARFFPRGAAGYDSKEADRLIAWLERCGYVIVPKEEIEQRHIRQTQKKAA